MYVFTAVCACAAVCVCIVVVYALGAACVEKASSVWTPISQTLARVACTVAHVVTVSGCTSGSPRPRPPSVCLVFPVSVFFPVSVLFLVSQRASGVVHGGPSSHAVLGAGDRHFPLEVCCAAVSCAAPFQCPGARSTHHQCATRMSMLKHATSMQQACIQHRCIQHASSAFTTGTPRTTHAPWRPTRCRNSPLASTHSLMAWSTCERASALANADMASTDTLPGVRACHARAAATVISVSLRCHTFERTRLLL